MYNKLMTKLSTFILKRPENINFNYENTKSFLLDLTTIDTLSGINKFIGKKNQIISLETVLINQEIIFLITIDEAIEEIVKDFIQISYPTMIIEKINDPLYNQKLKVIDFKLKRESFYPINTFDRFTDVDPILSILKEISKNEGDKFTIFQIVLEATDSSWQSNGANYADFGTKNSDGTYSPRSDKDVVNEKISYPGFKTSIRIGSNSNKTLTEFPISLSVLNRIEGNSIIKKSYGLFKKTTSMDDLYDRKTTGNDILNILEIATIWHPLSEKIQS